MGTILLLGIRDKKNFIEEFIIMTFSAIALMLIARHEPWADEAQAWLIARDLPDIGSLVHQMGYEGSPALWHVLLMPLAKLGLPYQSMAILNFIIMLVAVMLFVKASPFPLPVKVLFPFGYYILFEYTVIARSYSLTVLLLFIIALLYRERFSKPLPYVTTVLLLANTNIHGLIMAIAITVLFFIEAFSTRKWKIKDRLLTLLIPVLGIVIAGYQLIPPPDIDPNLRIFYLSQTPDDILASFASFTLEAFIPIRIDGINFWSTIAISTYRHLIMDIFNNIFQLNFSAWGNEVAFILLLASFIVFSFVIICLIKKPVTLILFLFTFFSLQAFFIFKYPGSARHHGLLFIFFIFSLWISYDYPEITLRLRHLGADFSDIVPIYGVWLIVGILLVGQSYALFVPLKYSLNYNFSNSRDEATFLIDQGYINDHTLIVGSTNFFIDYLPYIPGHSQLYSLQTGSQISYITFNTTNHMVNRSDVIYEMNNLAKSENYSQILLITGDNMSDSSFASNYDLIATRNVSIVSPFNGVYIYKENMTKHVA